MHSRFTLFAIAAATLAGCAPSAGKAPEDVDAGPLDGGGVWGQVSTLAGNGTAGYADGTGGPSGTAEFNAPIGVAVDAQGNVYVGDSNNARIRKIDSAGNVTTVAGNGTQGYADGTGGPNGTAVFHEPEGVAVDLAGNVYVADAAENRIRVIDAAGSVTTLAGAGQGPCANGTGGAGGTATFETPSGVAVDHRGNVYVVDVNDYAIRKILPDGTVSSLAGNGCPVNAPKAFSPAGVAIDAADDLYVTDFNSVVEIDPSGAIHPFTGSVSTAADVDGPVGATPQFNAPVGVALDIQGNVYIADSGNSAIRKITTAGSVITLAGNGTAGFLDGTGGPRGAAELSQPTGIAVDSEGNVYFADTANNRIWKIVQTSP